MTVGEASISGTVRTRTNLALHHLLAAGRCAAQISVVEHDNDGRPLGSFWDEILQNALGVVTLSVASLECYANELWFEQAPARFTLNEIAAEQIADLIDRESILAKYSLALALYTGKTLDFGREPIQSAQALVKLRNGIVHFRPEWTEAQGKHGKLSKLLDDMFTASQFFPNEPLFPRAWASGDFGVWAIRSTVNFLDHFYSEAGLVNPLEKFKPQLAEVSFVTL